MGEGAMRRVWPWSRKASSTSFVRRLPRGSAGFWMMNRTAPSSIAQNDVDGRGGHQRSTASKLDRGSVCLRRAWAGQQTTAASRAAPASDLAATCEICTSSARTGPVLLDRCLDEPTTAAAPAGRLDERVCCQPACSTSRFLDAARNFARQRRKITAAKTCGRQMPFQIQASRWSRAGGLTFHYFWSVGSSHRLQHHRQS